MEKKTGFFFFFQKRYKIHYNKVGKWHNLDSMKFRLSKLLAWASIATFIEVCKRPATVLMEKKSSLSETRKPAHRKTI